VAITRNDVLMANLISERRHTQRLFWQPHLCLAVAIFLLPLLACTHKGVNHKPVKDLLYAFASGYHTLYSFDADSLTVRDSITGFADHGYPVEEMVVTPDGRWLFTTGEESHTELNRVRKINTLTMETVAIVETVHRGHLQLLDHGRLLRWGDCDGFLADVSQFPAFTPDTTQCCLQQGPEAGMTVAGAVAGTNHIRVETVQPRATVAEFVATRIDSVPVSGVYHVALHPDGKRVSATVFAGRYFFIVAEVATGKTIYQNTLASPLGWFVPGEIAINTAGTIAAVTDPGKPQLEENVGTIDVIDLLGLRLLRRFDRTDLGYPQSNGQVAFTTNEDAIIVTSGPGIGGIPSIYRIDLASLTVAKTGVMPDTESPGGMTVGPAPEE
jgi:DNA-binding beta-propeller fold protein YncE